MKTTKKLVFVVISCFAQLVAVSSGGDELLESWKKITTNYANDIQQSNKILYKIKEELRVLTELRTIVERHLRTKSAEILLNALNTYNFSAGANNLQEIVMDFDDNYDQQMNDGIFSVAIEEALLTTPAARLPQVLWSIYQQNNSRSFEIMLRAQLQLYNRFRQKQHTDEKQFLYLFANKLHKIKEVPLYKTVDLSVKLNVQTIIEQLPNNMKYLYFMPYFCLQNAKYNKYIYTAIEMKVDPLSRYIWLWRDSHTMDDTGYIKAEVSEINDTDENKLYVALKGTKYHMYYYMMPNTKKIAGWDSFDEPLHHIWEIEFLDNNQVVFSQNDYLMCAVGNHDNERRNVAGLKRGEVSALSPECQWRLGQCNFN